jgi:hypothetical protein
LSMFQNRREHHHECLFSSFCCKLISMRFNGLHFHVLLCASTCFYVLLHASTRSCVLQPLHFSTKRISTFNINVRGGLVGSSKVQEATQVGRDISVQVEAGTNLAFESNNISEFTGLTKNKKSSVPYQALCHGASSIPFALSFLAYVPDQPLHRRWHRSTWPRENPNKGRLSADLMQSVIL